MKIFTPRVYTWLINVCSFSFTIYTPTQTLFVSFIFFLRLLGSSLFHPRAFPPSRGFCNGLMRCVRAILGYFSLSFVVPDIINFERWWRRLFAFNFRERDRGFNEYKVFLIAPERSGKSGANERASQRICVAVMVDGSIFGGEWRFRFIDEVLVYSERDRIDGGRGREIRRLMQRGARVSNCCRFS